MNPCPKKTYHKIIFANSNDISLLPSDSIDMVLTSPPYPMIRMWDQTFALQNKKIDDAFINKKPWKAFELMHEILMPVWRESFRILKNGGFICVNIGDATRTINKNFCLYPNHAVILKKLTDIGFNPLPLILWRKQTNAPNKFMGSGMLPAGAYVTLEHEYILILRKGEKRIFASEADKKKRRESAIFWEERNLFYSDIWSDIKGARQKSKDKNQKRRSGEYPFELAYRLINMYSLKNDTILDPFLGTAVTTAAAIVSQRNSIGIEIDKSLRNIIDSRLQDMPAFSTEYITRRIDKHNNFVTDRIENKKNFEYKNRHYRFQVVTNQETELFFPYLQSIKKELTSDTYEAIYSDLPVKS